MSSDKKKPDPIFDTNRLSPEILKRIRTEQNVDDIKQGDGVMFYMQGRREPLVIRDEKEITLGRRHFQDADPPVVDLNDGEGHMMGVSRRHAVVHVREDGCYLEDLGSTNGTWLNETQLEPNTPTPLKSGSQIRLGGYVLSVYY